MTRRLFTAVSALSLLLCVAPTAAATRGSAFTSARDNPSNPQSAIPEVSHLPRLAKLHPPFQPLHPNHPQPEVSALLTASGVFRMGRNTTPASATGRSLAQSVDQTASLFPFTAGRKEEIDPQISPICTDLPLSSSPTLPLHIPSLRVLRALWLIAFCILRDFAPSR
jgi:hypothetical protein